MDALSSELRWMPEFVGMLLTVVQDGSLNLVNQLIDRAIEAFGKGM